jgi:hypothetical protein
MTGQLMAIVFIKLLKLIRSRKEAICNFEALYPIFVYLRIKIIERKVVVVYQNYKYEFNQITV